MTLDGQGGPNAHILRQVTPKGDVDVPGVRKIDAKKVVEVALNPDDELRNLQVALLYSIMSAHIDEKLVEGPRDPRNPGATNANWFTIAQWAVLTVGRNLRTAAMPHRASVLPERLRRRLTPAVLTLRAADDRRVATALSYGQVMVFASVFKAVLQTPFADGKSFRGHVDMDDVVVPEPEPEPEPVKGDVAQGITMDRRAVQYLDEVAGEREEAHHAKAREARAQREMVLHLARALGADIDDIKYGTIEAKDDTEREERFYQQVLSAITKPAGYEEELKHALHLYAQAVSGSEHYNPERKPHHLIFEATLRIAAIEQVILDAAVTQVVEHLPKYLAAQAEGRLSTFAERSLRVPRRIAEMNASRRVASAAAVATDVWARVMTDQVMVVALPAETIRLGRDIPRRDWRKPFYAPGLEDLDTPARVLFDTFDRSLGDGRGAGAGDWRRFDDRMNFVANLLRSRQQDSTLFWQPFTDEDVEKIWCGQYPARIADPFEQAVRSPAFPPDMNPDDLDTVSCEELEELGQAEWSQQELVEDCVGLPLPGELDPYESELGGPWKGST